MEALALSMILTMASALKGAAMARQKRTISACRADPVLTRLFTPAHPRLRRDAGCAPPRPLPDVAPRGWTIDAVGALEAFGGSNVFGGVGGLDRSALARLYGGRSANVARGWLQDAGRFESGALVS